MNKKAVPMLGMKRVTHSLWEVVMTGREPEGLLTFYLFLGLGAENMSVFSLWEFFQLYIMIYALSVPRPRNK